MNNTRFCHTWAILLLLVLCSSIFHHTLSYAFLPDWDDNQLVLENDIIQNLSVKNVLHIFDPLTDRSSLCDEYLPIRDLVSSIVYYFAQDNPWGHRLTNIVLHTLVTILVYGFLCRLKFPMLCAMFAAAFFAIHPVHLESVVWISSLKDVLAAVLFFAALHLFVAFRHNASKAKYIGSVLCYTLACLAKANVIVLPAILIILDVYFLKPQKKWLSYIPYLITMGLCIGITILVGSRYGVVKHYLGNDFFITLRTMAWVLLQYIRLLFLPLWQQIPYPYSMESPYLWVVAWTDIRMVIALSFWCPLLIWVLKNFYSRFTTIAATKKTDLIAFSLLWFIITIAPVANLVPISEIMAERYLYLPSFAACLLLASIASNSKHCKTVIVILGIFCLLFVQRSFAWQNSETLWLSTINNNEQNPRGYYKLAWLYTEGFEKGIYQPAAEENRTILRNKAIDLLLRAVTIDSQYASAHNNLACIYLFQGNISQAALHSKLAFLIHPEEEDFQRNFEYIYDRYAKAAHKRFGVKHALKVYREGLQYCPDSKFLRERIRLLMRK